MCVCTNIVSNQAHKNNVFQLAIWRDILQWPIKPCFKSEGSRKYLIHEGSYIQTQTPVNRLYMEDYMDKATWGCLWSSFQNTQVSCETHQLLDMPRHTHMFNWTRKGSMWSTSFSNVEIRCGNHCLVPTKRPAFLDTGFVMWSKTIIQFAFKQNISLWSKAAHIVRVQNYFEGYICTHREVSQPTRNHTQKKCISWQNPSHSNCNELQPSG